MNGRANLGDMDSDTTHKPRSGSDDGVLDTVALADAPRERPATPIFHPGLFVRQYQLIRELGRGGMGTVFLARDTKLGRKVAIKFVTSHEPGLNQRFIVEARATAGCTHENIVVIHEVDEVQGYPYMVLEYLSGKTLRQWLDERALEAHPPSSESSPLATRLPVPVVRVLEFMIPVVRALLRAHELGIVHRDLKPANIMLTDAGVIKVLDFGLAKQQARARPVDDDFADDERAGTDPAFEPTRERESTMEQAQLTRTGAFMGTLAYMSPEQWGAGEVDHRSDLFAVGVMLFEMVAGHHPLAPISLERLRTVRDLDEPWHASASGLASAGALGPIIDRCLIKNKHDRIDSARALLHELEAVRSGHRGQDSSGDEKNPFTGLAAFQKSDANRFFGRDRDIECVVEKLRSQPLVALLAPSGTGKSSLVRAGVLPALERSGEGWESYLLRPGRRPLSALANLLSPVYAAHSSLSETSARALAMSNATSDAGGVELAERLRAEPGLLGAVLRRRAQRKLRRIVLFVDQFEELYTLCPDPDERAVFAACLEGVADDASSPLRVILSMRSDFFDRVAADAGFISVVTRGLLFLAPIDRRGLRAALTRPVEAAGFAFESPAMVEQMLDMLVDTPGALPLLQFTASKLWEARDRERRLLTEDSYRAIGGVEGTLASHADAVLSAMSGRQQVLARRVLERLVTPERTRAVLAVSELQELTPESEDIANVIEHLAAARLLVLETRADQRASTEGEYPSHTVELVHESLIERWPTLRGWLDESVEDTAFLARLRAAAVQWDASGRVAGSLWRDEAMHEARRFQERYRGDIPAREAAYLQAVFALAEGSARRRKLGISGALALLLVIASMMGYLALREGRAREHAALEAERANLEAERANLEAERARDASRMAVARELADDPTLALSLLREVGGRDRMYGWREQVQVALDRGVARHVLHRPGQAIHLISTDAPEGVLVLASEHDGRTHIFGPEGLDVYLDRERYDHTIVHAELDAERQYLLTSGTDGTACLWRVDVARARIDFERALSGHTARLWNAHFSPDGRRVLTVSQDGTARVFARDGSAPPVVLRGHTDWVMAGHFTPDGTRVVTVSFDKTARVWNADGTGQAIVLAGHANRINEVELDASGERVVTASFDGTARVWNIDGSGQAIVLAGHDDWVMHAVFSPDGTRVATASYDRTARVFRLPVGGEPAPDPVVLAGHQEFVTRVHFTPDGDWVLTASKDRTARVWPVDGRIAPVVLRHSGAVHGIGSSADGRDLVSYDSEGSVRLWDLSRLRERLVTLALKDAQQAVFSADGTQVLASYDDGRVGLWSVPDFRLIGAPAMDGNVCYAVALSPDGARMASGCSDGRILLWDSRDMRLLGELTGHTDEVFSVAFSPDGTRLASGSRDHTTRVWNADGSGEPLVWAGHTESIAGVAFSPDGARVATAAHDHSVRLRRVDGTGQPIVLTDHGDRVWRVVFSADGTYLASAAADAKVRVWRLEAGEPVSEPRVLIGHSDMVVGLAFHPDSRRLASTGTDGTVRIWRVDETSEPIVLSGYEDQLENVVFSPDGDHLLTTSHRNGVQMRPTPPERLSDDLLWSVSDYCVPILLRHELLGFAPAIATRDFEHCRERTRIRR